MADTTVNDTVGSSPEGDALIKMADSVKNLASNTTGSIKSATDTFGSMIASEISSSPVLALGLSVAKSASKDMLQVMSGAKARDEKKAAEDKAAEDERKKLDASNTERELVAREKSADAIERVELETAKVTSGVDRLVDIWDGKKSSDIERKRESDNAQEELVEAIEGIGGEGINGKDGEDEGGLPFTFTGLGVATMLKSFGKWLLPMALVALKKVFLPIAIVTALWKGISSAFDTWNDSEGKQMSTRVYETLRDFFGGIIEAVTFGLIDKEAFAKFIDDSPLKTFFTVTVPDVFDTLIMGLWEMVSKISRDLVPDDVLKKMDERDNKARDKLEAELAHSRKEKALADRIRDEKMVMLTEEDRKIRESALIASEIAQGGNIELATKISNAIKSGDNETAYNLAKGYSPKLTTSNRGVARLTAKEEMEDNIKTKETTVNSTPIITGSGNVDNRSSKTINNYGSKSAGGITRPSLLDNMQ